MDYSDVCIPNIRKTPGLVDRLANVSFIELSDQETRELSCIASRSPNMHCYLVRGM